MSFPLKVLPSPQMLIVVFLHRRDEHGAGDGAAERGGVEVGHAGGRDVEGAAAEGRQTFGDELGPAVDQPRLLGAVGEGAAGNILVVGSSGWPRLAV